MSGSCEAAITLTGDLHARPAEAVSAMIGILAEATPVGG
jgi:hypothetical protein